MVAASRRTAVRVCRAAADPDARAPVVAGTACARNVCLLDALRHAAVRGFRDAGDVRFAADAFCDGRHDRRAAYGAWRDAGRDSLAWRGHRSWRAGEGARDPA